MATEARTSWLPNWAVPPGEVLLEALEERGMSQAELARRTDRPTKTINEIVKGKAAITADTALQLELVLGIPASFWIKLEALYRERLAREEADSRMRLEEGWIDRFPIADMIRQGILAKRDSKAEQLAELLRFFGVSSPSAWERHWRNVAVSFRQSSAFTASPGAISVWLRVGEIGASKLECAPFSAESLEEALPQIRPLTRKDPLAFWGRLVELLRGCGVALVLVRELPGTHVSGVTRWLSADKVLVQLSGRHRRDDQFWFALFHELGHVLRGNRRQAYLDLATGRAEFAEDEAKADEFARDQLIPPDEYQLLVRSGDLSVGQIKRAAERMGLSEGLIVGRLQRDGHLAYSQLNSLKRVIEWPDEAYR